MTKYGAIIARFQIMYLHEGHRYLIDQVSALHRGNIIILLGVSQNVNYKNLLPFEVRKEIVLETYPNAIVLPLYDVGNDDEWSKMVDDTLKDYDVSLYGSRDSFIDYYSGSLEVYNIEPIQDVSATEIREQLRLNPPKTTDYRSGYIVGSLDTIDKLSLKYRIIYEFGDGMSRTIDITSETKFVSNEVSIVADMLELGYDADYSNVEYLSSGVVDNIITFKYFVYGIFD